MKLRRDIITVLGVIYHCALEYAAVQTFKDPKVWVNAFYVSIITMILKNPPADVASVGWAWACEACKLKGSWFISRQGTCLCCRSYPW